MTQEEKKRFIDEIAEYTLKYAPAYDICVVSPIIAQAIQESGWGRSKLSEKYFNFFGMKCGSKWKGRSVNLATTEEYSPGITTAIKDNFRVYTNTEEGVKGYFDFIQLERYKGLKGVTDPLKYMETLKAAGYATESSYVSDIMKIIQQYNLTEFDKKLTNGGGDNMARFRTEEEAINSLIATAEAEEGYLEKRSNKNLDSKTANAGSGNFTKYWRDVKPSYQGQYWCAVFVSWCFMVVFGQAAAEKLLKHWPFVYCPTLAAKTKNKKPKRGAIVLFWKPGSGRYGHTGIVYKVTATYLYTIEGNTSGASGVVSNGGGVVKKRYKLSDLHEKTLYFMPDYSLVVDQSANKDAGGNLIPGECSVTLKQFLPGAEHNQIKAVQRILNALGYKGQNGKTLTTDGVLGEQTVYAVQAFQKAEKLSIQTPGTIAGKTWTALLNK